MARESPSQPMHRHNPPTLAALTSLMPDITGINHIKWSKCNRSPQRDGQVPGEACAGPEGEVFLSLVVLILPGPFQVGKAGPCWECCREGAGEGR